MDAYNEAHLFTAAVRVLTHTTRQAPSLEDVCTLLEISLESGHALYRSLRKQAIIEGIEDPFSIRLSIGDHRRIEDIPKQEAQKQTLADELRNFKNKKSDIDEKFAALQRSSEKKKLDLAADIEARFKQELKKRTS
ncbi:hypothetical protein [Desulforhopalus singaporensis]|uniref:Uncharacterized protein n=1 Tax=Desulforhopalus singaporensis TaxID=91360 RepID=A0A1H0RTN9_9BACT|nr:hypothetical protein [Desulforhopalus singaporensis]SDP32803.1 hypothetical protein SAMN05660330_02420 [Desulforhopalus singaporensis]